MIKEDSYIKLCPPHTQGYMDLNVNVYEHTHTMCPKNLINRKDFLGYNLINTASLLVALLIYLLNFDVFLSFLLNKIL